MAKSNKELPTTDEVTIEIIKNTPLLKVGEVYVESNNIATTLIKLDIAKWLA